MVKLGIVELRYDFEVSKDEKEAESVAPLDLRADRMLERPASAFRLTAGPSC